MAYEYEIKPEHRFIAQQNGIPTHVLWQRVRELAWHMERAITTPIKPRKSFGQWTEIAKKNGIKPHTFRARVNRYGWGIERAATQPLMDASIHMKNIKARLIKDSK